MLFNNNSGCTNVPWCTLAVLLIVRVGQDLVVAAADGHIVPPSGEEGTIKMTLVKIGY